jgi:EmrB/QacA subfamily drug resistance transporter
MAMDQRASEASLVPFPLQADAVVRNRGWLLCAAILATSLGFIDASVMAIAMPIMRTSLGASLQGTQWISNSYLLVLSSLVLVGGAAGDRFGVARIFRAGILVFVLASLGCAVAQTTGQMIAARTVQGFGAALMVPASMALIARIYPREERGRALGIWAAASTGATALGPVLGGLLLTYGPPEGWRVIFAINLPVGLLAWWLLASMAPHDPGRAGTPIDWVGAGLATVGLGLISLALINPDKAALLTGLGGVLGLALFLFWEARNPHPMMPLALFARPGFAAVNLATFFLYFALTGVMFYLPMTALSAWRVTEIEVTAAFVPTSLLIGALSAPAGRWADRFGAVRVTATGCIVVAIAYLGLALTAGEAAFWARAVPCMMLAGLGMALVVAPLTVFVMAAVDDGDQGAASGINNAVARVASMIAVAMMGTVAAWAYGTSEPGFGLTASTAEHLAATARAFGAVAGIAALCAGMAAAIALTARSAVTAPAPSRR